MTQLVFQLSNITCVGVTFSLTTCLQYHQIKRQYFKFKNKRFSKIFMYPNTILASCLFIRYCMTHVKTEVGAVLAKRRSFYKGGNESSLLLIV